MDGLGLVDIELQRITTGERNGKLLFLGQNDRFAVFQFEVDVVVVLRDAFEYRIAAIGAVFSVFAGRFAEVRPCCAVVGRNVPITVLDFQLRRHTVFAVLSIGTRRAGLTVCTVFPIFSVFAIAALGFDFIAAVVGEPLAVERPIINVVGVLLHADNGHIAYCTATIAVLVAVDRNRGALAESESVADCLAVLLDGRDTRHAVVALQGWDDRQQRRDVGVGLLAELFEFRHAAFEVFEAKLQRQIVVLLAATGE